MPPLDFLRKFSFQHIENRRSERFLIVTNCLDPSSSRSICFISNLHFKKTVEVFLTCMLRFVYKPILISFLFLSTDFEYLWRTAQRTFTPERIRRKQEIMIWPQCACLLSFSVGVACVLLCISECLHIFIAIHILFQVELLLGIPRWPIQDSRSTPNWTKDVQICSLSI